jgi:hypothetical protein
MQSGHARARWAISGTARRPASTSRSARIPTASFISPPVKVRRAASWIRRLQESDRTNTKQPRRPIRHLKGGRKGGYEMKRVMILTLMLFAVLVPLTGIAHADLKSDEAIEQAP